MIAFWPVMSEAEELACNMYWQSRLNELLAKLPPAAPLQASQAAGEELPAECVQAGRTCASCLIFPCPYEVEGPCPNLPGEGRSYKC